MANRKKKYSNNDELIDLYYVMNDDNTETELDFDLGESDYDRESLNSGIIIQESEDITRLGSVSQNSSKTPFKLFRFSVGLSHLEKLFFALASAYKASASSKKSKWWIFGSSTHTPKNKNFRNPTNYIPIDPQFYANQYSQKDCTLKGNCKKDINHDVSLYPKTLFETKIKIFKNQFSLQ